jgi:putative transcriptional regulator
MAIRMNLNVLLAEKHIKAVDLADAVGITPANLSILRTGKARAIRFSTLEALCRELSCQPGDLLTYVPEETDHE